ncbi:MAG: aminomethyl-transferring glycine dehydrogenase subunit GcvPA [Acholeplasmataceae bacterium]
MHKYLPHTPKDIEEMLEVIGADSIDELFASVPESLLIDGYANLPSVYSDDDLTRHMRSLSDENKELVVFRGAGSYDHYAPSVIRKLIERQEFLTSYTPYQPEVAQGTLQYIFEFQSMVCELTGMDVSNASMYDGATATAEAMLMAHAITKRKRILISSTVPPRTIDTVRTYARNRGIKVVLIEQKDGKTDRKAVELAAEDAMALIVSDPNYYGIIEDLTGYADILHGAGALLILNAEAQSLALLKTPAEYGADIACGDMQSLGLPLSFGGSYLGYLATTNRYVRKMPGRICGITNDVDGKRAFVLTLQAREQHIRRAKANSNICSNQSLMALAVTIYLSLLGKKGLRAVAKESLKKSHVLHDRLIGTGRFEAVYDQPFYKEFVLKAKIDLKELEENLLEKGILGPLAIAEDQALFAVTERRTEEDMNALIEVVKRT